MENAIIKEAKEGKLAKDFVADQENIPEYLLPHICSHLRSKGFIVVDTEVKTRRYDGLPEISYNVAKGFSVTWITIDEVASK